MDEDFGECPCAKLRSLLINSSQNFFCTFDRLLKIFKSLFAKLRSLENNFSISSSPEMENNCFCKLFSSMSFSSFLVFVIKDKIKTVIKIIAGNENINIIFFISKDPILNQIQSG